MANYKNAIKYDRQNKKRYLRNKSRKSDLKTARKKLLSAIDEKDATSAMELFKIFQKKIAKITSFHKNKIARNVSAINAKIKKIALK